MLNCIYARDIGYGQHYIFIIDLNNIKSMDLDVLPAQKGVPSHELLQLVLLRAVGGDDGDRKPLCSRLLPAQNLPQLL